MPVYVLLVAIGAVVGAAVAWLSAASRSAALRERGTLLEQQLSAAKSDLSRAQDETARQVQLNSDSQAEIARLNATIEHERKASEEKLALVVRASEDLKNSFHALASEALQNNNQSFLALATESLKRFQTQAQGDLEQRQKAVETLVAPIKESLGKVDQQIQAIENSRREAYGGLTQQVRSLIDSQQRLQAETGNLVKALRAPNVRGRWGEIQLRRVVEIAGMINYCDFEEQASVSTADGRLRPDLIVRLPGGKNVVVDAKTPLSAYLEACEAADENVRLALLKKHADQVSAHMTSLSSKSYWDQFQPAPEFVVMFLPGEMFFSAALEQSPALIEQGVSQRVIPASPTTLIALLRAVAYGWQQETIAENAQKIANLGRDLYDRLCKLAGHMETLGRNLDRSVDCYNRAVGTMESRVFAPARRLAELGAAAKEELPDLPQVEKNARLLQSPDWERGSEALDMGEDDIIGSGNCLLKVAAVERE
ncbi:MAG TPA: DNA recombination protein RmuC [Terriglobales bacterium]|jgi:DNA recombination protein RmuC|nr:DNA recombination protein RmuC [Terriglobales bacterium]